MSWLVHYVHHTWQCFLQFCCEGHFYTWHHSMTRRNNCWHHLWGTHNKKDWFHGFILWFCQVHLKWKVIDILMICSILKEPIPLAWWFLLVWQLIFCYFWLACLVVWYPISTSYHRLKMMRYYLLIVYQLHWVSSLDIYGHQLTLRVFALALISLWYPKAKADHCNIHR